jgi:hypothetical protein
MQQISRTLFAKAGLAVVVVLLAANPAAAHALGAECRLRGNKVEVEAYFDDDTPAQNAKVTVTDSHKQIIAEGRTDEAGRWSFPVPPSGEYLVLVEAGAGHSKRVKMTVPAAPTGEGTPGTDATAEGVPISEGPTRHEFTSVPVGRVALSLGIIAAGGFGAWLLLRRRAATGRLTPRGE